MGRRVEKANMLMLTKEAPDKDRSLKTQVLVSTSGNNDDKISGERVRRSDGCVRDVRPNLKQEKQNIPENALMYVRQAFLSTVKNGDLAMFNHNFIIGQIIPAANQPEDISTYECAENEVKLYTCIYDNSTGEFKGVRGSLAYIILGGDSEEGFSLTALMQPKLRSCMPLRSNRFPTLFLLLALTSISVKS